MQSLKNVLIRWNQDSEEKECGLCGNSVFTVIGHSLVVEKTFEPVCSECSEKFFPELNKEIDRMSFPD